MYWCKKQIILISGFGLMAVCLSACKPEIQKTNFFDISGYFTKEAARLKAANKPILKTVEHNKVSETRKISIHDWDAELSLFKNSDINKPAWSNSYSVSGDGGITIYKAKDRDLKTHEIMIKQENGKVKWIVIYSSTQNLLYKTLERLEYFPDSLYLIERKQSVRVLGTNFYRIKGQF